MTMKCPRCGHLNRPQATWCESCQKGLTLAGRMATPWARTGLGSRITTTWALFAGGGCLLLFVFWPLGLFLLLVAAMTQFVMKKCIAGICPYCGKDTGTFREVAEQIAFPCVHCQEFLRLDRSSGKPTFVKDNPLPTVDPDRIEFRSTRQE